MQSVKLVIVGDGGAGKTCMLTRFSTGSFPRDYVPTVFDNYSYTTLSPTGVPYNIGLWDTAGQEDYDRLRPLSYPQTDIFLLAFNVTSNTSFENLRHKWYPEVKHYCPGTPTILLGLKGDLRESEESRDRMVNAESAQQLAKSEGSVCYMECSALTGDGMEAIREKILQVLDGSGLGQSSNKKKFRWPWKRNSSAASQKAEEDSGIPPPPELPKNTSAPWINIPSSLLQEDWKKMINKTEYSDVQFLLEDKVFFAHKLVLCSSSNVFRMLFGINCEKDLKESSLGECKEWTARRLQNTTTEAANRGDVRGINSIICLEEDPTITEITLDDSLVTERAWLRALHFMYSGNFELSKDDDPDLTKETLQVAQLFNLPEIITMVTNTTSDEEFLNPSIGTWLNDRNSRIAKQLFLNQPLFSDVTFRVGNIAIPAHKIVLTTRCEFMSVMLTGSFLEGASSQIEIKDVSHETFLAFLEYLYTDHSPIENGDAFGILVLANQYQVNRLLALCELYISKHVEKAVEKSIKDADINIIEFLLSSQLHNAGQLSNFFLHFIASNYIAFEEIESFQALTGDNKSYVEKHRWPPLSYYEAMDKYKEKYGDLMDGSDLKNKKTSQHLLSGRDQSCSIM